MSFAELESDFLELTREIIWCTMTTVDTRGRPRSRVVHPIWQVVEGRPVGWVATAKTPVKTAHLAANPNVAFSYWSPAQHVVLGECVATWTEEADAKQEVWALFTTTPEPIGYDLTKFGVTGPQDAAFTPLRLDPWRVQVLRGEEFPTTLTPTTWSVSRPPHAGAAGEA
ncbi:pyridoxamine 5'-phosphate oxidase family protein [Nocardia sp. BMG51109]|uniref:pyridoxamine 5'-phosphate oxidase family protein n=1 Tax=Nocardia sp. BMG51109 TaxID=1056816 RepID=UPI0004670628|nr:pyridoxamine 5'-phosphate oxidase family protein [Nocardia sp. BMG51109]